MVVYNPKKPLNQKQKQKESDKWNKEHQTICSQIAMISYKAYELSLKGKNFSEIWEILNECDDKLQEITSKEVRE